MDQVNKTIFFVIWPFIELVRRVGVFLFIFLFSAFISQTRTPLNEPFYIIKWITLIGFVSIGLLNISFDKKDLNRGIEVKLPIQILMVFCIYIFLTAFQSINLTDSFFKVFSFYLMVIISFYIIPLYASIEKNRNIIINVIFIFINSVLILNLIYTFLLPSSAFTRYPYIRYLGITENPNTLGMLCFMGLPVLIYKYKTIKKRIKWWIVFLIILTFIFIIMTYSRASMLAVTVITAFVLYFYNRFLFKLGLFIGIIAIIFLILNPIFLELLRLAENPFSFRDQLLEIGLKAWDKHKIFGTGYGTAHILTGNKFLYFQKSFDLYLIGKHFHNIYLEVLAETGIVGFTLFLSLLTSWVVFSFKKIFRSEGEEKVFAITYTGLLLAVILHGLFESFLLSAGNASSIIFWILTALTIQGTNTISKQPKQDPEWLTVKS